MHRPIHALSAVPDLPDAVPGRTEHIVIAVCTCRRPIMLEACLRSLVAQVVPDQLTLSVLVVENDSEPRCQDLVSKLAAASSIPLNYCLETQQGIPLARNRAIEEALILGCDWLAFIDDDEVADAQWISELHRAAMKFGASVTRGTVIFQYPKEDRWAQFQRSRRRVLRKAGCQMKHIATNNVLISNVLFSGMGHNLRFDPSMRFTGGSDRDLFLFAHHSGTRMAFVPSAVVRETVPLSRCSLGYLVKRRAQCAINSVRIELKHRPIEKIRKKYSRKIIKYLRRTVRYSLKSAFYLFTNREKARSWFLESLLSLSSAYGLWMAFRGKHLNPYQNIHGH